jgi:hypothetical protein
MKPGFPTNVVRYPVLRMGHAGRNLCEEMTLVAWAAATSGDATMSAPQGNA